MKRLLFIITALILTVHFSACGQSGPLYIPGNPSEMAMPATDQTAGNDQHEEDSEVSELPETD